MAWSYKIFEDLHFSILKFSGEIRFDEMYEASKSYFEDPYLPQITQLLIDGSECSAEFDPVEILRLSKFLKFFQDKDNHKKVVSIMVTPKEVACAEIFKWLNAKSKREYCHTTEKAYALLDLPISYEEFLEKKEEISQLNEVDNESQFRRSG